MVRLWSVWLTVALMAFACAKTESSGTPEKKAPPAKAQKAAAPPALTMEKSGNASPAAEGAKVEEKSPDLQSEEGTPTEEGVNNEANKTEEPEGGVEVSAKVSRIEEKAQELLAWYNAEYEKREGAVAHTYWKAANSGKAEDFKAFAAADLELKKLHSDKTKLADIQALLAQKDKLEPLTLRSLSLAELMFKGNVLPEEHLKKMVEMSSEIEQLFNTFRGKLDGKEVSNNVLLEALADSNDSEERRLAWEGLKEVGEAVAPKLVKLAHIRNDAARELGFANFWDMQVRLQEHDPDILVRIFAELEKATDAPFAKMKAEMDQERADRFGIKRDDIMPWHYDNPFFQSPPPSNTLNLDVFYEHMTKEDIVTLGGKFYDDIGLPCDDIIKNSDFFERDGKDQHAFCISMDRKGDVRMLLNIKPTQDWMDTMLHESGHAVYYKFIDRTLPFNLREAAHIFTTEAVAMLFGALAKNPTWLVQYAHADPAQVKEMEGEILEQRRREQLVFARWTLVMFNFEKALYENPGQDLNALWWDIVERYQLLKRPEGRNKADWAAKPHFTIAPVYYHNYMLGELYAAQLRQKLAEIGDHKGPTSTLNFHGHKEFGEYLIENVFAPGMKTRWPEFVKESTGKPLSIDAYAREVSNR